VTLLCASWTKDWKRRIESIVGRDSDFAFLVLCNVVECPVFLSDGCSVFTVFTCSFFFFTAEKGIDALAEK
jgi:hypothetical protein